MPIDSKLVERVNALYRNPRVQDWLQVVADAEGMTAFPSGGYNYRFGGYRFDDSSHHPGIAQEYTDKHGKKLKSTAAGRYQFIKPTWDKLAGQLGLTDFSPDSQDKAAIALMIKTGAIDDILEDRADAAIQKLGTQWASLPGSAIGEAHGTTRTADRIATALNRARAGHGLAPLSIKTASGTTQGGTTQGTGSFLGDGLLGFAVGQMGGSNFLQRAFADLAGAYWQPNGEMLSRQTASRYAVSANPYATPENTQLMLNRMLNTDPNVQYGMAHVGGSIRPTMSYRDPQTGQVQQLAEYPDGLYVDMNTGKAYSRGFVNEQGQNVLLEQAMPGTDQTPPVYEQRSAPGPMRVENSTGVEGAVVTDGTVTPPSAAGTPAPSTPVATIQTPQSLDSYLAPYAERVGALAQAAGGGGIEGLIRAMLRGTTATA